MFWYLVLFTMVVTLVAAIIQYRVAKVLVRLMDGIWDINAPVLSQREWAIKLKVLVAVDRWLASYASHLSPDRWVVAGYRRALAHHEWYIK